MLLVAEPVALAALLYLDGGVVDTARPAAQHEYAAIRSPSALSMRSADSTASIRPYLVQFASVIQAEDRAALVACGVTLHGYIPDNAFRVRASDEAIQRVARLDAVEWIGEWKPAYKQSQQVTGQKRAAGAEERIHCQVVVFSADDVDVLAERIRAAGGTVEVAVPRREGGLIRTRVTADMLDVMAAWPEVEWIEPYMPPRLQNDRAVGSSRMNVESVWSDLGVTGAGQIIAICDTGLDTGISGTLHPDFADKVVWAEGLGSVAGWGDENGHGTHVAGSAVGTGSLSGGRYKGIAYQAGLIIQGLTSVTVNGTDYIEGLPADLKELFATPHEKGAKLHSNSWVGSTDNAYDANAQAVDHFMWEHPDFLVVAAAGNLGADVNPADGMVDEASVASPGTAKNALTVGASENYRSFGGYSTYTYGAKWPSSYPQTPISTDMISSHTETSVGMAAFSGRGPCMDGRIKPDVIAPGTDIVSTRSRVSANTGWGLLADNTNYFFMGGTSMATPLTSGAAALVREWLIEKRGMANPSAALVKAVLINGAKNMSPGQYMMRTPPEIPAIRPNTVQGWGHVDVEKALAVSEEEYALVLYEATLEQGETHEYRLVAGVRNTNGYTVTLAYTDYYAALGAGRQLVNDLDVTLETPSGALVYANGGNGLDVLNNVEMIEWRPTEPGVYSIRVHARNIPNGGAQPYALVMHGNQLGALPVIDVPFDVPAPVGRTLRVPVNVYSETEYHIACHTTTAVSPWTFETNVTPMQLVYTPTDMDLGEVVFTFSATNDSGGTTADLRVSVQWGTPPVIAEIPQQSVSVEYTLDYSLDVQEADQDDVVLTCDSVGGTTTHFTFDPVAGDFSFMPDASDIGMHEFLFTAADVDGVATRHMTVVVQEAVRYEDFAAYPVSGSAYESGIFRGHNNVSWTYESCSGAINTEIVFPTPCMRHGVGRVASGFIPGGCDSLSFFGQQGELARVDCEVYINGALMTNITAIATGEVQEFVLENLHIEGPFWMEFVNKGAAFCIDDIQWTSYSSTPAPPLFNPLPGALSVMAGGTFVQNIKASGTPPPQVALLAGPSVSGAYSFTDGRLSYTPAPADVAQSPVVFSFTAENIHGIVTQVMAVAVLPFVPEAPGFLEHPAASVRLGELLYTRLQATGRPAPVVSVTEATVESSTYTLDSERRAFSFFPTSISEEAFVFSAVNEVGSAEMTLPVSVLPPTHVHHALIVGVDQYAGLAPEPLCAAVSATMQSNLLAYGKWQPANTILLNGAEATREGVRTALLTMASRAAAGDVVLYYHAGRGGRQVSDGTTYLQLYDAPYPAAELTADLELFAPGVTVAVLVDAPYAEGLMTSEPHVFAGRSAADEVDGITPAEIGWLVSTTESEETTWQMSGFWASDVFFHADANLDGGVTLLETYFYSLMQPHLTSTPLAANTNVLDTVFVRLPTALQPPQLSTDGLPEYLVNYGATIEFDVQAISIMDDDILLYSLHLPEGAVMPTVNDIGDVSATFRWMPTLAQQGKHEIVFSAADDNGVRNLTVFIEVRDGSGGRETFDGITWNSGAYLSNSFIGQAGSTWTYAFSRTDLALDGRALTLGKNIEQNGWVQSGVLVGGINELTISYFQHYDATPPNAIVYINGESIGRISATPPGSGSATWQCNNLQIPGEFTLTISNAVRESTRLTLDNITWSGYPPYAPPEFAACDDEYTVMCGSKPLMLNMNASGNPAPVVTLQPHSAAGAVAWNGHDFAYTPDASDVSASPMVFTFVASNHFGVATQHISAVVVSYAEFAPQWGGMNPVFIKPDGAYEGHLALAGEPPPSVSIDTGGFSGQVDYDPVDERLQIAADAPPANVYELVLTAGNQYGCATQIVHVVVYAVDEPVCATTELFISEYVEGSEHNKAIELFNGTGMELDLSAYSLKKQVNGVGAYQHEYALSGVLTNGATLLLINAQADDALKALGGTLVAAPILDFNGNDAIGLFKNAEQIDEVGHYGSSGNWGDNLTLRRKFSVTGPTVPYDIVEWDAYPQNTFDGLGRHAFDCSVLTAPAIVFYPPGDGIFLPTVETRVMAHVDFGGEIYSGQWTNAPAFATGHGYTLSVNPPTVDNTNRYAADFYVEYGHIARKLKAVPYRFYVLPVWLSFAEWMAGYDFSGSAHPDQLGIDDDADGDGFTNGQEYTAGTDPANLLEFPYIAAFEAGQLSIRGVAGRTYRLRAIDQLDDGAWTAAKTLDSVYTPADAWLDFAPTDEGEDMQRFYHLLIQGPEPKEE